jgi:biopolymer transport protein ExbB
MRAPFLTLLVTLLGALSASAQQQASPGPSSLDALLEQVRQGDLAEREENARREAEFRNRKDEQRRLLEEALATRAAAEKHSEELERQFEENETLIPELEETLRQRMGTLGELFGVVRQVAGDTKGVVESSLVSAQLPGRGVSLARLAQAKELPSVDDLELLWFALQQEMTESGKIVRFPATVLSPGGQETERTVTRIGVFNVVADGRYLQYLPETGKLVELARQPASRHLRTAAAFEAAADGLTGVAIDPSRGSILALLIQSPELWERVQQGGLIGYITIVLGLLGLLIVAERLIHLGIVGRKIQAQTASEAADAGNPLGRVLAVYQENRSADVETLDLKLDEAILKETPALERGNTLIKVLSVVAPLLGLLGTVTGMIQTFESITLFGTGDPKLMAGGISQALVTTVLGLTVAIPLVLLHTVVSGRSRRLVQILEEQSAGLIAEHAETLGEGGKGAAAA